MSFVEKKGTKTLKVSIFNLEIYLFSKNFFFFFFENFFLSLE